MKQQGISKVVCALGAAAALCGCGDGSEDAPDTVNAPLTPGARTPGANTAPAANAAPSAEAKAALSLALTTAVDQADSPGVVGLVVGRDGVLFEGTAGQLDVANGTPMPPDAIFNIASMTKPVTSVAVMMLYEQGKVGLDDPVSRFLPGFDAMEVLTSFDAASGAYEAAPSQTVMTVRHLLSHTSGIGYAFCNTKVARLQQGTGKSEWELPLLSEPGAEWHYSASTRVLGRIVEQVTGQTLESYYQEQLFVPLGMPDTSYAVAAAKLPRVPTLHVRGADGSLQEMRQNGVPTTPTAPFGGDGGLYSTARDYGRFMRMFLNGGTLDGVRILSEASVAMMGENQIGSIFVEQQEAANPALTKPFPLGAGKDKFGLGFEIASETGGNAQRSAGSLAWAGLFNTEFWIDPQRQIAGTLLMQVLPFYDDGALRALAGFEAAVYQNLLP